MSNEINVAFVNDYTSTLELLLQQEDSRFRGAVNTSSANGKQAVPVDQVGAVAAVKKTVRHSDTPIVETPHARRWCVPQDYHLADLIDNQDMLRTIINPQSPYARNQASALRRAQDDEIISAALATSKIGEDGDGTEAFDTTNYDIVAGAVGMTIDKLRTAKRMFMAAQVKIDSDPLYVAISAEQHDDLLSETQAISLDYTTRPVLMDGRITAFMGFNFIDSERLASTGSTTRYCFAWAKSGLHLCIWEDVFAKISERDDKDYATQVYARTTVGATRTQQGKVIRVQCAE